MRAQLAVARAFVRARLRTFENRAALTAYQERHLARHLAWLNEHIPYYRDLTLDTWASSATMNRAEFTANFAQLNALCLTHPQALELALQSENAPNLGLEGISAGLSSGTSGSDLARRGVFLTSARERWQWAGVILAKALPQVWREPQRVALFLRSNSALYEGVRSRRVSFAYFDLLTPLEQQLARLNSFKPTVIVAPPSRLRVLAELRPELEVTPATLFAGAEVLEPLDQRFIETAFNRPVRQIYQATEGFLGITCALGGLHLNEDNFVLQKDYIDKASGRFVPILTDFQRRTQAIVRYRLDDLLRETTCGCGSVLQAVRVEGRERDIFQVATRNGATSAVYPDELRKLLALEAVEEFQINQIDAKTIHIQLAPYNAELVGALRVRVTRFFEIRHLPQPQLYFAPYTRPSGSDKLRRVTSRS